MPDGNKRFFWRKAKTVCMKPNLLNESATNEVKSGVMTPAKAQVAATAFLSLFSIVGLSFYGLPFFYDFFEKEFHWSRETITSGNFYGKVIVGPMFGFLAGWFIDKLGPRRLMLAGVLMGGASLIGLSQVNALWLFYLCYFFNALGYVCGGPLPNQVLLSRWFDKGRGKAMGFAYLGIGIGGAIAFKLANAMEKGFGWHTALMTMGILMIVIAFPMVWFVKDAPEGYVEKKVEPSVAISGVLKRWPFYLLAIGSLCSIGAVAGTNQHLKFFLIGQKYSQDAAANIGFLVLASSIAGRLLMGWLADRFQKKYVMLLIYLLVASSVPLLFYVSTPGMIYVFAVIFGIGLGGDYMIIPLMAAELFGVRVLGRVMGIILVVDGIAEAYAPKQVARIFDQTRSYNDGFALLIGLAALGAVAIALLPRKPLP
jgi:sugar phosphate permease